MKKIKLSSICLLFLTIISTSNASYNPKKERVLICGVGKNVEPFLPNMIKKIESLGESFQDYRVIIYENNSTDKTASVLKGWALKNHRVILMSETLSAEDLSKRTKSHAKRDQAPCRMELIAYARNAVLQKALSAEYDSFNVVVMTELDFAHGWQPKDVIASCMISSEWDCITANGIDYSGNYYDRYAYRDERFILGPELIGEDFWHELGRTPIRFTAGSGLKKVYSAFGGLALYKREALMDCSYSGYVTQDFKRLMSFIINNHISKKHKHYALYKKIINCDDTELPIKFQANCGYDGPVVCEHSTLHATMILNGYDKLYVNPDLICQY